MNQGEFPAHQQRSRAAREKIVNALDGLLKHKSWDQISVAEIAKQAGVAVGTVYQRFKNKEALLPILLEIYYRRLGEWMTGKDRVIVDPEDDMPTALRKMFRQAWVLLKREAHLLRTIHLQLRLRPELAEGLDWKKYEKASAAGIRALVEAYSDDVKRENLDRAIDFATYYFNAIMIEKGLFPEETPGLFFRPKGPAFADECADMLYGYLTLGKIQTRPI